MSKYKTIALYEQEQTKTSQNKVKKVSEYDQGNTTITNRTQTPWYRGVEPLNHHETPGRQIKQSNQLSLHHQDDCNTKIDIK